MTLDKDMYLKNDKIQCLGGGSYRLKLMNFIIIFFKCLINNGFYLIFHFIGNTSKIKKSVIICSYYIALLKIKIHFYC